MNIDDSSEVAFWESRPRFAKTTAIVKLDGQYVLWPQHSGPGAINVTGSIVADFFDGVATVRVLAEDFAEAAGITLAAGRSLVGELVDQLTASGALDSHQASAKRQPASEPDNPSDFAAELAGALAGAGSPEIRTEHLPDGRTRLSTQFELESGDIQARSRLIAEILAGNRSIAELVPPDSCLGYKLRIGQPAAEITLELGDSNASIRCDDPAVESALRLALGTYIVDDGKGPTIAFVVAPLEGDGPCRVFDAAGRRRGRPRTPDEVIDVVSQLLAERVSALDDTIVRLTWGGLVSEESGVLVAPQLLGQPRIGAAARTVALSLADCQPVLENGGRLSYRTFLGTSALPEQCVVKGIVLADDLNGNGPGPAAIVELLRDVRIDDDGLRRQQLRSAMQLVQEASLVVQSDPAARAVIQSALDVLEQSPAH